MNAPVISINNLSKRYILRHKATGHANYVALRDVIADKTKGFVKSFLKRDKHLDATREEFWALNDVSFDVHQGDRVAIIGRNGAGKSTLLKILSRITEPTRGSLRIRGRVASLLEVGTGFHPELTGRENVFLNGAILGMTKSEIKKKFDEIVAFAEVERFLDTPVKRYSSGMYVRLAFAVAAHLEPEILVVDEVLAVGDAAFQKKCMGKMEDVGKDGRTVLFVSHNMAAVSLLCSKGVLLEKGKLVFAGGTHECIERYAAETGGRFGQIIDHQRTRHPALEVTDIAVNGDSRDTIHVQSHVSSLHVNVRVKVKTQCRVALHAYFKDRTGQALAIFSPGHLDGSVFTMAPGEHELTAEIALPPLLKGHYLLELGLAEPSITMYADFPEGLQLTIDGFPSKTGLVFEQCLINGHQVLLGHVAARRL